MEIKFRAPHAIDATLSPWPHRLDGVEAHEGPPTQAEAGRKRDRLLDIYTSCNRINLRLWNEVSQPEILSDIDMDAWKRLCRNYADACALTGMVILVEGVELDLRLPWLRDEDQDWLDVPVEDNEDPPR